MYFFCDFENIYRLSFLDSWKYFCLFLLHLKYCDKYMERYDRTWSFDVFTKNSKYLFFNKYLRFKEAENSYYWTPEHPEGSSKGQTRVKFGSFLPSNGFLPLKMVTNDQNKYIILFDRIHPTYRVVCWILKGLIGRTTKSPCVGEKQSITRPSW